MQSWDCSFRCRPRTRLVSRVWLVIEPHTPFVPGWHIDAITDYLEAVTRGEIRNRRTTRPTAT